MREKKFKPSEKSIHWKDTGTTPVEQITVHCLVTLSESRSKSALVVTVAGGRGFLLPGGGGLPYKSDGDSRRLALRWKLQISVSLKGVYDGKSQYLLIQFSLSTAMHKEIYKICPDTDHTEISLWGQFKLEPHSHWSPLEV